MQHCAELPRTFPFVRTFLPSKQGSILLYKTDLIDLDILGEVGGIGFYDTVKAESQAVEVFGLPCRVLALGSLIRAKKFAGRRKDEPVIFELEALKEMKETKKK
ncbi:MAG TPA: hypothetical protein VII11_01865 [Bacteroidota bacterium]